MYVISPVGNIQDAMSEASSLDGTGMFNDNNAIMNPITDEVTAQLANAGPAGVAAAAAISTRKNRKRPHSFEINPSIRKRQQTRLLRKLLATLSEYTTRVGQQAVILCCTPGKSQNPMYFRVFGSQPLETVMKSQKSNILSELDQKLALQAPCKTSVEDGTKHELPLPNVDGIPTPIDKMTQAQLRMFIPEMLKFSTCRSKPGWNKPEYKPPWWPDEAPWANVRCDMRTDEQKKQMSWTDVLRNIVLSCYNYHGRQDLLPSFKDDSASDEQSLNDNNTNMSDGVNQVMNSSSNSYELSVIDNNGQQPQTLNLWQTLSDGGLSLVHLDSTCTDASLLQLVTFPDGSQAHVLNSSHIGDTSNVAVDSYSDPNLSSTDEVQLLIKSESGYQLIPIYQQPSQLEMPQSSELLIKPEVQYSEVHEAVSTSIESVVLQSQQPMGNVQVGS